MELKKTVAADLENQRDLFLMIGFVVVFGLLYIAFEWSKQDVKVFVEDTSSIVVEEEEMMDITVQPPAAPPPPAPAPPVVVPEIKIVENNVETKASEEVFKESKVVVAPPPPAPIVEEEDANVVFVAVEKNPEYPGGIQALYEFLGNKIVYPSGAKEAGIQGRVICQFVVNKDGSIVDIVVVKGVDRDLDEEAIRVIKLMPKWTPGQQSGKKVRVKYTLPIVFKINN